MFAPDDRIHWMLKNARHEAFCLEYMKDHNAGAAYVRAGYASKGADQNASRLIRNDKISTRITELRTEFADRLKLDANQVLARYVRIATADRNELMSIKVGACRYCHGTNHAYQWRTEHEFQAANADWKMRSESKQSTAQPPQKEGGFGYRATNAPSPQCPMCDGEGLVRIVIHDTSRLSEDGRAIFAGAKQTRHGIEVKTHSALVALNQLAKILVMFEKADKRRSGEDDKLSDFIKEINKRGSKAVLTANRRAE